MTPSADDARRSIPQVERLVRELEGSWPGLPRPLLVDAVRTVVEAVRERARRQGSVPTEAELDSLVRAELERRRRALLGPVINATGVVLHTNLGRAPLSPRALEAVVRVASGYSNLEWDPASGRRGDRFAHTEPLLALATGAEAALVVNNNAAAVLLVCAALGAGGEVVISRGELIEIGGEFRIPEVLALSGAKLREVGTTNRTHLRDYENAIGEATALVLKVHPSNYRVVGFTASPGLEELSALAGSRGVPLVYDAGSGLLARPLADEPLVSEVLGAGADLVCFSGDKLLGGPQAGIVCGSSALVGRLRRHPFLRAVRPDKMQLAALQATVLTYLEGSFSELPAWQMLDASPESLHERADRIVARLEAAGVSAETVEIRSVAGGGSLPGEDLPSFGIALRGDAAELSRRLRLHDPPIVVRIDEDTTICDLRTVPPDQDTLLTEALQGAGS